MTARPTVTGALAFIVLGDPVAQGSKRWVGRLIETNAKTLDPWRESIRTAAQHAKPDGWQPLDGPVYLDVMFTMRAPKTRPKWRLWPDSAPDLDKLVRAVMDALTSVGVWCDDAQVVGIHAVKCYPVPISDQLGALDIPGAAVSVTTVTGAQSPQEE